MKMARSANSKGSNRMDTIPSPQAVPIWVEFERQDSMQVDERVRRCAAFVGAKTERGFLALGTGFFVFVEVEDFLFDYFITAQHLVWPNRRKSPIPDQDVIIRVNTVDGSHKSITTKPKQWIFPEDPSIDVCAYPFDGLRHDSTDELDVMCLSLKTIGLSPESESWSGISLGDEVFIAGAFVGRVGYRKNIPIIRIGNIAAMPEEPIDFASPRRPAYLIETRSLGGTSGSPVFLNLQSQRSRGPHPAGWTNTTTQESREPTIFPYLLIGMIISMHGGNYPDDFVSEVDTDIQQAKDVEFNAGIAVALPISIISEIVTSGRAQKGQMARIDEKRKISGVRPASSRPESDATPATDANPTHREDFTNLLGAAARKPEPKD
jgi:hypothetical protein